ncbi:hypothetical protein NRIC_10890 [Enterococcus florum]|uniref:Uncharacterized protein n=1 Tax=Enterococcus florum TaxID=2480627 RepID=A0A4P5PB86_9ENTE|nr:hypothetical protein [Enterococcus florum]GCF93198.1 hypothetical protein NRIC_10890 [Enterococcus florum]
MACPECYSEQKRTPPLWKAEDCLVNHQQYICGACGRCICIQADEKAACTAGDFRFEQLRPHNCTCARRM